MLRVRGLTKEYTDGDATIRPLDGLDLDANDGELVLLLGPSGSGKTTLLSCLAGLLTPSSGSITVGPTEVAGLGPKQLAHYRRHSVGVVFQAFNLIASLTARENVMVPLRLAGVRTSEARKRADELLERVALSDRTKHRPVELSGGQQQRVAIARALALDPPLLLADEPSAHLDFVQVQMVITLLRELARPGRTVVVATHDDRLLPVADRAVDLVSAARGTEGQSRTVTVSQGEVIFEEGSRGTDVFVIETGQVEIYAPQPDGSTERVTVIREGSYFGEMGPLLGLPRSRSARALTDCVLTVYDVRDFRHLAGAAERERMVHRHEPTSAPISESG